MGKLASLTSADNYFEDFEVGQVIRFESVPGYPSLPLDAVDEELSDEPADEESPEPADEESVDDEEEAPSED